MNMKNETQYAGFQSYFTTLATSQAETKFSIANYANHHNQLVSDC
jgi:hypothetical protein